MKKEWDLSYIGQITAEQMTGLCSMYGSEFEVDGQPLSLSTPELLNCFAIEGISILVAEYFFKTRGYATQIVDIDNYVILFVSHNKIPVHLIQRKEQLKRMKKKIQDLRPATEQEAEELIEEKKRVIKVIEKVEKKINQGPFHYRFWPAAKPTEPPDDQELQSNE
jgi:hypothetical protein